MNEAGACPGDRVLIAVAREALLRASLVVYAVPVLGLLAGAAAAQVVAGAIAPAAAEPSAGIGGLAGAAAGALAARRLARRRGAAAPAVRVVRVEG